MDPTQQAALVAQARRMVALLSVGVGCLVASPMFYLVGKVVDRPMPDFVSPAIVGDWAADDGRTLYAGCATVPSCVDVVMPLPGLPSPCSFGVCGA